MRQRIARILKRWPALYAFVSLAYFTLQFNRLQELLIGTRAREKYWAARSFGEGYWTNRDHPSKHFLAEKVAAHSPFRSILEVGCASGPNLYSLAKKFPQAQITGIDINQEAIEYGNRQFAREGMANVKLLVGQADELNEFADRAFDIVLTNALLIYIGPDKIKGVAAGMLRLANRALVLVELHFPVSEMKDPYGLGVFRYGEWVRDYVALFKQFVPEERIRVTKIPEDVWPAEPWKELGHIVEVTK